MSDQSISCGPYRGSGGSTPRPSPGPRLLDDAEVAFWERCVLAIESCSVLVGTGIESGVTSRADMFVLLRRERLPVKP